VQIKGRGRHFKNVNARRLLLKPKQCQMGQQVSPVKSGQYQFQYRFQSAQVNRTSGQVGQKLDQLGEALLPQWAWPNRL